MLMVFKREHSAFKEFSCGIVGSFGISQRETQDVLRNKWGKTIEQVIGINPILSKGEIFRNLHDTRQEFLEKIGLTFNEFGEVAVGYIDIKKYITLFLSQPGVQSAVTTPNNNIMIMDYTDGFPWLKWSRHFREWCPTDICTASISKILFSKLPVLFFARTFPLSSKLNFIPRVSVSSTHQTGHGHESFMSPN